MSYNSSLFGKAKVEGLVILV